MLPRLSLKSMISGGVVRAMCDAYSRKSLLALPPPQSLLLIRGLRVSPPRNDEFLGLLATLLEFPSTPEPTVPEPTVPEPTVPEPTTPKPAVLEPVVGYQPSVLGLGPPSVSVQDSRKRIPIITTLSPERLTPADVIHLPRDAHTLSVSFKPLFALSSNIVSSKTRPSPASPTNATATTLLVRRSPSNIQPRPRLPHEVTLRAASGASELEGVQFPAGLACLYYYSPPAPCTPLAGALRLRTLPSLSGNPKAWTPQSVRDAFARGHDFCVLAGMPWHIPVLALPLGSYDAVRAMLLHEGLVAPRVMHDAGREGRRWSLKRHSSRVLSRFGQPFVVDLSTKRLRFYFVGRRMVYKHVLWDLCSWNPRDTHEAYQPFTGKLICAFERSTYPGHVGKTFVRIRVVKVLTPVRRNPLYSGPQDIPLPRANGLLSRGIRQRAPHRSSDTRRGKRQWSLWLANVENVFKEMRVLFENDPEGMAGGKRGRQ
ncbi:hypothetical protein GSI_12087 [Ganoderma sinense ZZ0214-1]|uniref:Uncharacterized protein n=1 Tax=Ganoderma sinense ZZ0214-1 TaxID=1077348 RepID=A0A2G8RXT8_9APHY|nr:hypothetical protein GSI_12087 [Ganoderma sinense ZZ0214-1]